MYFARWEDQDNFIKDLNLVKFDGRSKLKNSGIPLCGNDDIYLDTRVVNSIVIGSSDSGKNETIITPMLNSICLSGESALVVDENNAIYNATHDLFEKEGYNIYKINFDDPVNGNSWNVFDVVVDYYKNNDFDKLFESIDKIAQYLIFSNTSVSGDPFWVISATNYFQGLVLYSLSKNEEITLNTIYDLNVEIKGNPKEFLDKMDKNSREYLCLSSILKMSNDTFSSIVAVFEMAYRTYMVYDNLNHMLSGHDLKISNIFKKSIIFVAPSKKSSTKGLLPLMINQIFDLKKDSSRFTFILNDFNDYKPITDFSKMLSYSRDIGISFVIIVYGLNALKTGYGDEHYGMIMMNARNVIYLLSQDINTLEEISDLCGMQDKDKPLISIEELKILK